MDKTLRMKIAVLGATGQTGQFLVNQALQQGHTVTAVVRNPGKLPIHHDNLKVVEADIFSADSLTSHFKGQDVIMSCLGFPTSIFSSVSGYTQSMQAMVSAMREARVNRIITMTSWYTEPNSGTNSPYLIRFLLLPMIRSVLTNMYEMEQFLQDTKDVTWTVVRPPGLKNLPASAQEFLTHEGYFVPQSSGQSAGGAVGRGDVARFMLSLVSSNAWVKRGVAITTK
ncbi:flavin reductase (NADPH)-like isoform X1 [Hippoglossus stenolepis]|uniref:flavin reductase (NADPH)-like isoform X1 n=2 Tax=Hippoglossus stenolepis TaxID=195615 RepID=UPI001FAFB1A3|nr:flavin reductase (NADPH)-like isoform X1 [Hippoglossus stenolepis]